MSGLAAEYVVSSTLDGKLVHTLRGGSNIFTLLSPLPRTPPVICELSHDDMEKVRVGMDRGRFVSLHGDCHYLADADFPYKIRVRTMEALPPPEALPSLDDIRGIAPGATGDQSPEQFVRDLRDQW